MAVPTIVATALVVAACGSPGLYVPRGTDGAALASAVPQDGSLTPQAAADETQWQRVVAGMAPDGSVPLETALQAWVVAVGPLPGVAEPEGEPADDAQIESAIRWVLRHWDALTVEQRAAVQAFLDGDDQATAPHGIVLAAAEPRPQPALEGPDTETLQEWTAAAQQARDRLRTLLGRPLRAAVNVEFRVTTVKPGRTNLAFAIAQNAAGEYHRGPMKTCHIWIPPIGQGLGGADVTAVIAHEMLHCYQYELTPVESVLAMPDWIIEGPGAWAGEEIVANGETFGGSIIPGNNFWNYWLRYPGIGLFERGYDAIGFYAHLKDEGVDVWKLLDRMQKAMLKDSFSAYEVAFSAAKGEAAVDAWGPSLLRDVANAPLWDTRGPGMQFEVTTPVVETSVANNETLVGGVPPLAALPLKLDMQAQTVTFIAPAARGKVRFSDGSEQNMADILGRPICTSGSCECPEGSYGAAHSFVPGSSGLAMVGLTGHTDGIELTIQGYSLDLTCQLAPEDFQPPEPCMCPSFLGTIPGLPAGPAPHPAVPLARRHGSRRGKASAGRRPGRSGRSIGPNPARRRGRARFDRSIGRTRA